MLTISGISSAFLSITTIEILRLIFVTWCLSGIIELFTQVVNFLFSAGAPAIKVRIVIAEIIITPPMIA